jgi:hypothetical protein
MMRCLFWYEGSDPCGVDAFIASCRALHTMWLGGLEPPGGRGICIETDVICYEPLSYWEE